MEHPIFAILISIFAALGLAAACGFRVFIPMLVISAAARADLLSLSEGFAWLGTTPALVCLGIATVVEVGAYYVPVVDNFLDTISAPAAVIAGMLVAGAVIVDIDPWLRWTLAVIAGGGAAAAVKLPLTLTRGLSTATTGGLANSVVSTTELVASSTFSVLAILWPLAIPFVVLGVVLLLYRRIRRSAA